MNREELAWAAGFFDGEGCFSYSKSGQYVCVSIGQTVREPLERFKLAVGLGVIYGPYSSDRYQSRLSKEAVVHLSGQWIRLGSGRRSHAVVQAWKHEKEAGPRRTWTVLDLLSPGTSEAHRQEGVF